MNRMDSNRVKQLRQKGKDVAYKIWNISLQRWQIECMYKENDNSDILWDFMCQNKRDIKKNKRAVVLIEEEIILF